MQMRRQTVGPFHSSQFSPLVFIPLCLHYTLESGINLALLRLYQNGCALVGPALTVLSQGSHDLLHKYFQQNGASKMVSAFPSPFSCYISDSLKVDYF